MPCEQRLGYCRQSGTIRVNTIVDSFVRNEMRLLWTAMQKHGCCYCRKCCKVIVKAATDNRKIGGESNAHSLGCGSNATTLTRLVRIAIHRTAV